MSGYRWIKYVAVCALAAGSVSACISATEVSDDDDGGGETTPETKYVGAAGVTVNQVAVYQGVKRVLAQDGVQVASNVPLVAGRDALLRVFYTTSPERVGQTVTGRLFLWTNGEKSEEPILAEVVLAAQSSDRDLASTANFYIPGDLIGESFHYSVELVEEEQEGSTDNPAARHPVEYWEEHTVDGPQNTFRVVLSPFQYDADGSGRLPNLSDEAVELYRQRFLQLYPVSDVEVTVREPTPWSSPIQPNGQGWQEVGITLSGFRNQDGMSADVYYYGVFNPAASFGQFCGYGCLLGVTLLNDQPADTGNPGLRLALGVGFDEVARDTAAHELGHAHGREHANCGMGLDPNSIDQQFPHPGGGIGVWGYDIVGGELIDPAGATDIMGYCDNQWISDYNYAALLERGKNVNLPRYHEGVKGSAEGDGDYTIAAYDGFGKVTFKSQRMAHPVGDAVELSVVTDAGPTAVTGHHYQYDHMPGGWFVFPKQELTVKAVEASVDGRFVAVER
jgi:hypothetical protein